MKRQGATLRRVVHFFCQTLFETILFVCWMKLGRARGSLLPQAVGQAGRAAGGTIRSSQLSQRTTARDKNHHVTIIASVTTWNEDTTWELVAMNCNDNPYT